MYKTAYITGVILIVFLALAGVVSCTGSQEREVGGAYGEETAPGGVYEEPMPGVVIEPVNINNATVAELMAIPGMDQTTAQNIVQYREVNGPFDSVDGLLNVSGVDDQRLNSIRDWVTVEEPGAIQEEVPIPQEPSSPEQDSGDVFQQDRID